MIRNLILIKRGSIVERLAISKNFMFETLRLHILLAHSLHFAMVPILIVLRKVYVSYGRHLCILALNMS